MGKAPAANSHTGCVTVGGPGEGLPSWLLPLPRLQESTSSEETLHVAEGDGVQRDVADLDELLEHLHSDVGGQGHEHLETRAQWAGRKYPLLHGGRTVGEQPVVHDLGATRNL